MNPQNMFLGTKQPVLFTEAWLTQEDMSVTACCEHQDKYIPASTATTTL